MILDAQFNEQKVELNADFGIVNVVNSGDNEGGIVNFPIYYGEYEVVT